MIPVGESLLVERGLTCESFVEVKSSMSYGKEIER